MMYTTVVEKKSLAQKTQKSNLSDYKIFFSTVRAKKAIPKRKNIEDILKSIGVYDDSHAIGKKTDISVHHDAYRFSSYGI